MTETTTLMELRDALAALGPERRAFARALSTQRDRSVAGGEYRHAEVWNLLSCVVLEGLDAEADLLAALDFVPGVEPFEPPC